VSRPQGLEADLDRLAGEREEACEAALAAIQLEGADQLRKQIRAYLSRLLDYGRIKGTLEGIMEIRRLGGRLKGIDELDCPSVRFSSDLASNSRYG
jgi:hypothetical protein